MNSECAHLKECTLRLQEEREVLLRQVEARETQAQLSIDELGVQMEEAVMQKTAKVQELLDYAEELQDTLGTLVKEKDLLTTSLRQEAEYTRQLEEEKVRVVKWQGIDKATLLHVSRLIGQILFIDCMFGRLIIVRY